MQSTKEFKKQKIMFYLQRVFGELSFLGPIIGLFYLSRGLDFFQIMVLQVLFSIVFAISQIPTGIIADKFGRRISLIIGSILLSISMAIIALPQVNFLVFVISEVLFGIGLAFRSGADTAIMYSYLEKHNKKDEYSKIEGQANSFIGISAAICCVVSGYLYELNTVYPIIISAIWPLLGIISVAMLSECKEYKVHNKSKNNMKIFKEGFLNVKNSSRLKTILIYSSIFIAVLHVTFWFYPPSLLAFDIKPIYFGWIFMCLNIVYSLSSRFGTRFIKITKGYSLTALFMTLALGILICGIFGLNKNILFLLFFLPDQIARGWYPVVYNKFVNKYIKDDIRATVLSFMSMFQQVSASLLKLLFGYLLSKYEIFDVRIFTGAIMVVVGVALYFYMTINLQEKTREDI